MVDRLWFMIDWGGFVNWLWFVIHWLWFVIDRFGCIHRFRLMVDLFWFVVYRSRFMVCRGRFVVCRGRRMVGFLLGVVRGALICDLSNISIVVISSVLDMLNSTIRQLN